MSDLRIDREGKWYYRNVEMLRPDIVKLFYRHLVRDNSGSYSVSLGGQRCPVDIEDTAYVVHAVYFGSAEQTRDDRILLLLSDGTLEELDAASLRIGDGNVPRCRVKNGCFEARFSSSSYYRLADAIEYDSDRGEYFISLQGQMYYIRG